MGRSREPVLCALGFVKKCWSGRQSAMSLLEIFYSDTTQLHAEKRLKGTRNSVITFSLPEVSANRNLQWKTAMTAIHGRNRTVQYEQTANNICNNSNGRCRCFLEYAHRNNNQRRQHSY
jgi:hypothetical protein